MKAATTGVLLFLSACGGHSCTALDHLFNEPSCNDYGLVAQRNPIGGGASCTGSAFSRKVSAHCPLGSGTTNQCSGVNAGATLNVLLVPNNNGGTFRDTTGTVYSDCGTLWGDFFSGTVQSVKGVYASTSAAGDRLECNDTIGCRLTLSTNCISGWVAGVGVSGTASLANGTSLLACVYIDNSLQTSPPAPASTENFSTDPLTPLVISGNPAFSSGWKDAN